MIQPLQYLSDLPWINMSCPGSLQLLVEESVSLPKILPENCTWRRLHRYPSFGRCDQAFTPTTGHARDLLTPWLVTLPVWDEITRYYFCAGLWTTSCCPTSWRRRSTSWHWMQWPPSYSHQALCSALANWRPTRAAPPASSMAATTPG